MSGAGLSLGFLIVAIALTLSGAKDIDGWVDCAAHEPFVDGCGGWHWIGAFVFWTPLFLAACFALLALGALVLKGMKGRVRPDLATRR
ncbi:MAG: hypothetical protein H0U03_07115 [Actinobacteria bacterium]|nr:hypothetical protein [Actinomycetota bacterium]